MEKKKCRVYLSMPVGKHEIATDQCVVEVDADKNWNHEAKTTASYHFFDVYAQYMFQYMRVEEVKE